MLLIDLAAPVAVPLLVLIVLGVVLAGLVLVVWSLKVRYDPHFKVEAKAPFAHLVPSLAGLSHGTLVAGNHVEIVENGAYFDRLLADVAAAQHSVHFETFLWKEGEVGRRVAHALAERARAGVDVRVLVDANGSRGMGKASIELLKEAGCRFCQYHKKELRTIGRLNNRDHRKIALFDGRIGYVGGHCVVDTWLGDAEDKEHFRDLSARIEGPIVHDLQAAFSENWVAETEELFVGEKVFPALDAKGDVVAHVARIRPDGSASAVKILHHTAICIARERLWIQNPYFLPDPEGIDALVAAVKRGVDVRVMMPSPEASDMPMVQHAAHHNFDKMLAGGVRLFEYQTTLLHQKVMTADGVWCAIGSSNFDDRSFEINDEITVGFHSPELARKLEELFERDAARCTERTLDEWKKRSPFARLRDFGYYLLNEQL